MEIAGSGQARQPWLSEAGDGWALAWVEPPGQEHPGRTGVFVLWLDEHGLPQREPMHIADEMPISHSPCLIATLDTLLLSWVSGLDRFRLLLCPLAPDGSGCGEQQVLSEGDPTWLQGAVGRATAAGAVLAWCQREPDGCHHALLRGHGRQEGLGRSLVELSGWLSGSAQLVGLLESPAGIEALWCERQELGQSATTRVFLSSLRTGGEQPFIQELLPPLAGRGHAAGLLQRDEQRLLCWLEDEGGGRRMLWQSLLRSAGEPAGERLRTELGGLSTGGWQLLPQADGTICVVWTRAEQAQAPTSLLLSRIGPDGRRITGDTLLSSSVHGAFAVSARQARGATIAVVWVELRRREELQEETTLCMELVASP
ncbi:MAG: hypothetical protein FJ125_01735 [Deltaproteobacteria bacterium]|nr:hypothetical protein [Deltaproteobacteria bacterium]